MKRVIRHLLNAAPWLGQLVLLLAAPPGLADSIVNSKHNLSASGPGVVKAVAEPEICIFCHTPHNSTPDAPLWTDYWSGPPFVVYGHMPRPYIYKLKWSVGIDTGCVLGGQLTAYVLPEKCFVQVKARQRYWT